MAPQNLVGVMYSHCYQPLHVQTHGSPCCSSYMTGALLPQGHCRTIISTMDFRVTICMASHCVYQLFTQMPPPLTILCFSFIHYEPQFSSVTQLCLTLYDSMNRSMSGLPVHHQLLEFTQTHVHRVGDTIQPSHPLSSPPPPSPDPSLHQGLFQWVNSSHEVAKILEFQLQHQSFQWTPRTDLL